MSMLLTDFSGAFNAALFTKTESTNGSVTQVGGELVFTNASVGGEENANVERVAPVDLTNEDVTVEWSATAHIWWSRASMEIRDAGGNGWGIRFSGSTAGDGYLFVYKLVGGVDDGAGVTLSTYDDDAFRFVRFRHDSEEANPFRIDISDDGVAWSNLWNFPAAGVDSEAMTVRLGYVQSDAAGVYKITRYWEPASGGGSGEPALAIDQQPSTTPSGFAIDPAPVVQMTTDGSTVDTSFTGDVTAEMIDSDGVLFGTLTVAAVAGVATFAELRPCEAGGQLRFSAAGVDPVDSIAFTVLTGTGSPSSGGDDMISVPIRRNEGTAALRHIYMLVKDEFGVRYTGSVTGVKAELSVNGGETDPAPADIVPIVNGWHYVEITQPNSDLAPGTNILASLPSDSGLRGEGLAQIIPADAYVEAIEESSLVKEIVIAANGGNGFTIEKDYANNQLILTVPGEGPIYIPARFASASLAVDALGVE